GDRVGPHDRASRRGYGLGSDRLALRPLAGHSPVTGRRAQPRHRRRAARGSAAGTRGDQGHRPFGPPCPLSLLPRCARRARAPEREAAARARTFRHGAHARPQSDGAALLRATDRCLSGGVGILLTGNLKVAYWGRWTMTTRSSALSRIQA